MRERLITIAVIALIALSAMGWPGLTTDNTKPRYNVDFSMSDLEKDAQSGNANAQCALGFCHMLGINTAVDMNKCLEWFDKSAIQGNQMALAIMAMFYMEDTDAEFRDSLGIKLQPDSKKACDYMRQLPIRVRDTDIMERYRYSFDGLLTGGPNTFFSVPFGKEEDEYLEELEKEAATGNATTQYQLACYYSGYSTEMDGMDEAELEAAQKARKEKEMYWLRLAAEQGHADAQITLGLNLDDYIYDNKVDKSESMRWFKAAADQGDVQAMKNLAFCYLTCENPDTTKAVELYRQAAECGDEDAQLFLANCYYLGKGVPQNYSEAFKMYQSLSQRQELLLGPINIYEYLGNCYLYGRGVEKNLDKAFECYNKIKLECYNTFSFPNYQLAQYYEAMNQEDKALEYYKRAAEDNYSVPAVAMLAGYYYDGSHGLPQDYKKAAKYYGMIIDPQFNDTTGWFLTIKESMQAIDSDSIYGYYQYADSVFLDTTAVEVAEDVSQGFDMGKYADRDFYKQAMSGDASAQLKLGKMLMKGDTTFDCMTDNELAAEWLEKAALQGNAEAQYLLAQCYEEPPKTIEYDEELGEYVVPDISEEESEKQEKAMYWYLKAAENGIPEAQLEVGRYYYFEDMNNTALKWYLKAAQAGLADAQNSMGDFYRDGELVDQNYSEAVKWYKKAAAQNDLSSCESLGQCYLDGTGVAKDANQAIYWFEKAAYGGNADVATMLGDLYAEGGQIPQNYKKAIYWYTIGANESNIARNNLGELYLEGKGTAKDYKKAVYWFRRAAEDGMTEAQYNLSECYQNGWGVKQSASQAKYWENKAEEETEIGSYDLIEDVEF